MSISVIISSIVSGAASGAGAGYLILQWTKDRWIEKIKAGYAKELEGYKDQLQLEQKRMQARIDRSVFVSRAQFETEFAAMKDVFGQASAVKIPLDQLRPMFAMAPPDQNKQDRMDELSGRLNALIPAFNQFSQQVEILSPFYSERLYAEMTACRGAAAKEITQIRLVGSDALGMKGYIQGSENCEEFAAAYRRAAVIIRERVNSLAVISHWSESA